MKFRHEVNDVEGGEPAWWINSDTGVEITGPLACNVIGDDNTFRGVLVQA